MWRLLLACTSLVAAQNAAVYSFSGNFSATSPTMTTNQIYESSGDCSTSSSGYYYTTFTVPFATAGFRTVQGFGFSFLGFVAGESITLNTTNPCNSTPALIPLTGTSSSYGPEYSFGQYFTAGNYTFVVANYYANEFGGEFWEGMYNGQITNNATWEPLYAYSSSCSAYTYTYTHDAQRFTVASTGYYSLFLAFSRNSSAPVQEQVPNGVAFSLFSGDLTATNFSVLDCATAGSSFLTGSYSSSSSLNAQLFSVHLTAGTNYTFVASAYLTYASLPFVGRYSVVVAPQIYLPFSSTPNFIPPNSHSCDGTLAGCSSNPPNAAQESSYVEFTVPKNSWFYLFADQLGLTGGSSDLEYWIYSEDNSLRVPCGSYGGVTCVNALDSMSGVVFYSGSSTNFSVIATGWSTSQANDGVLMLYILKGAALPQFLVSSAPSVAPTPGASAAPTTAAPSAAQTAAPTTAGQTYAPTTRMPTVAGQTYAPTTAMPTTTTMAPTPGNGTTVGASALHVPCAALGLALCLAL